MTQPSTPNGQAPRPRNRGAIRTHLGRKRTGARRMRGPGDSPFEARREQEHLFDKMLDQVQSAFGAATEKTADALDVAIDTAFGTLESATELTLESAERLRTFLKRDVLHRDHPTMTFRTGDITSAGTVTCTTCGWTIQTTRTSVLPPCPQCRDTTYRKTA